VIAEITNPIMRIKFLGGVNMKKINAEKMSELVKKYAPKEISLDKVELVITEVTIRTRIAVLKSRGYSDEEILRELEGEE